MLLPLNAPKPVLDDTFFSRLAYELACSLYTPEQVFTQFGISSQFFADHICNHPAFIAYYAEARQVWYSTDNSLQRFTKKAGIVLEEFLPELNRILHDPHAPASAKATFAQWLSKVAGADNVHNAQRGPSDSGAPTVTINITGGPAITLNPGADPNPPVEVLPTQVTIHQPATPEPPVSQAIPLQMAPQPATDLAAQEKPAQVINQGEGIGWWNAPVSQLEKK